MVAPISAVFCCSTVVDMLAEVPARENAPSILRSHLGPSGLALSPLKKVAGDCGVSLAARLETVHPAMLNGGRSDSLPVASSDMVRRILNCGAFGVEDRVIGGVLAGVEVIGLGPWQQGGGLAPEGRRPPSPCSWLG